MDDASAGKAPHQHQHHDQLEPEDLARLYTRDFWEERYSSAPALWSGRANQRLVEQVGDLPPGTALDVACGEGGDALWLATQGWVVTAVDISSVALGRAREHAETAGPEIAARITWEQADLLSWSPRGQVDLVSAHYLHLPPGPAVEVQARLAAAVRPGGTLLLVGHDRSDLETTVRRPHAPDLYADPAQIAARLDPADWDIVVAGAQERPATDAEGRTVTVRDAVVKAVRR